MARQNRVTPFGEFSVRTDQSQVGWCWKSIVIYKYPQLLCIIHPFVAPGVACQPGHRSHPFGTEGASGDGADGIVIG
jgi:hypothetical protein